jgi:hypothetical protein
MENRKAMLPAASMLKNNMTEKKIKLLINGVRLFCGSLILVSIFLFLYILIVV